MIKIILLLIVTNIFAGFFDSIIQTPQNMMDFYNKNTPEMIPIFDREKRLEKQIYDEIMDGEVIYLKTKDRNVFSIFTETEEQVKAGVILLHTRGMHPNEEDLIKPLRIDMTENGYHTLSVQMPVLDKNATYYDYVPLFIHSHPRIKAAINFYKKMGIKKIIIVAHGCGAHMAMSYFDKYNDSEISSFIGIGMGATDTRQEVIKPFPIEKMQSPILDIVAQYDYLSVKKHARKRLIQLQKNKQNKQIKLEKSKHYYKSGKEFDRLTKTIYQFLDKK